MAKWVLISGSSRYPSGVHEQRYDAETGGFTYRRAIQAEAAKLALKMQTDRHNRESRELHATYAAAAIEHGYTEENAKYCRFTRFHAEAAERGILFSVIADLHVLQLRGYLDGFSMEDIKQRHFEVWYRYGGPNSSLSLAAAEGLSNRQIRLMIAGLDRERAVQPWARCFHTRAHRAGIPYEEYAGLDNAQVQGLIQGLRRDQVENDWFSLGHIRALEAGHSYEEIEGLTWSQVSSGILKGLSRVQAQSVDGYFQLAGLCAGLSVSEVRHEWFDSAHALAAEMGVPYKVYAGLNYFQVMHGILRGLKRRQVEGVNPTLIYWIPIYKVPCASLIRGCRNHKDIEDVLQKRTECKVALAMASHHRLGGSSYISDACVLERIASYL